ncbi:MAG: hypothetical protein WBC74_05990 [Candidatus Omnitrophota bacterium]
MRKVDGEIQRFIDKGSLIFTCRISESQQVYLPQAIMDYLQLSAGKDTVAFEVQAIGPQKGEIRFARVGPMPKEKNHKK